ncbi:MAG: hypothetical protein ABSC16_05945 [Candidatus Dormibacteria bacterium]
MCGHACRGWRVRHPGPQPEATMTLTLIESGLGIAEHRFEVSVDGETVPR